MVVGLLGRKVGMTQIFDPTGQVIPVTVIQAGPCHVLQVRTRAAGRLRSGSTGVSGQAPSSCQPRRSRPRRQARQQAAEAAARRRASKPLPKADCEPQAIRSRIPRRRRRPPGRPGIEGRHLRGDQGRRRGRHQQGPRHRRRDEAAPFPRPAGLRTASRRCTATPARSACNTDPHHVFKGRRMAGHYGRRTPHRPQSQGGPGRRWKTICCWSAARCPGPTAAT